MKFQIETAPKKLRFDDPSCTNESTQSPAKHPHSHFGVAAAFVCLLRRASISISISGSIAFWAVRLLHK